MIIFELKLIMSGTFPGSPDSFRREISEDDYDMLMSRYFGADKGPSEEALKKEVFGID